MYADFLFCKRIFQLFIFFYQQAYRRETSSVRIAKIIGLTVVVSSFIFGAFILASSYLQARASCDQMQTLDSILEKELMLETLQVSRQRKTKIEHIFLSYFLFNSTFHKALRK